jgi:hypothetical protein
MKKMNNEKKNTHTHTHTPTRNTTTTHTYTLKKREGEWLRTYVSHANEQEEHTEKGYEKKGTQQQQQHRFATAEGNGRKPMHYIGYQDGESTLHAEQSEPH